MVRSTHLGSLKLCRDPLVWTSINRGRPHPGHHLAGQKGIIANLRWSWMQSLIRFCHRRIVSRRFIHVSFVWSFNHPRLKSFLVILRSPLLLSKVTILIAKLARLDHSLCLTVLLLMFGAFNYGLTHDYLMRLLIILIDNIMVKWFNWFMSFTLCHVPILHLESLGSFRAMNVVI